MRYCFKQRPIPSAAVILSLALVYGGSVAARTAGAGAAAEKRFGGYDVFVTLTRPGPEQRLFMDGADGAGLELTFDTTGTRLAGPDGLVATGRAAAAGELHVKRRRAMVELSQAGELLLRTWSRHPLTGIVAPAGQAGLKNIHLQPVADIVFDDSFLDPPDDGGLWEHLSGKWEIGVYRDALVQRDHGDDGPIGAAWLQVTDADRAVAVTGYDFWDSYRATVAAEAAGQVSSGLIFYCLDADNYALLAVKPGPEPEMGRATVSVVRHGVETVLAQRPVTWRPGVWYELTIETSGSRARCAVAGRILFDGPLPVFTGGRVGLFADGPGRVRFDNLQVRSSPVVRDDFRRPGETTCGTLGQGWVTGPGQWQVVAGGMLRAASTEFSGCLWPEARWPATAVSADVSLESGAAGLCINWSGRSGYALGLEADRYTLTRYVDGAKTLLATGPVAANDSVPMSLSYDRGRIALSVGDTRQVTYDVAVTGGAAGLFVSGGARFAGFEARELPAPGAELGWISGAPRDVPGEREGTRRAVLGYVWRSPDGRWRPRQNTDGRAALIASPGDETAAALWYFRPVPGDAAMTADRCSVPEGATLGLAIACTDGDTASGYALELSNDGDLKLSLLRQGRVVAETRADEHAGSRLALWRDGDWIAGRAGASGLAWRDEQPLRGDRCGAYASDADVVVERLAIGNRGAYSYSFEAVEPDWQPETGEWMTHSGLACIAWNYWLTAKGTPEAMVYHIARQPHDLHVDFWVGEHAEGFADGNHVHYPYHNISLVTCAREPSADSGYRFLIAGRNGDVTQLLRLGEVVAETADPRFRIRMGGHNNTPRAINVVASQRQGELTLQVNGVEALRYTDPEPLGSGYVGIGVTGCSANFRDLWMAPLSGRQDKDPAMIE